MEVIYAIGSFIFFGFSLCFLIVLISILIAYYILGVMLNFIEDKRDFKLTGFWSKSYFCMEHFIPYYICEESYENSPFLLSKRIIRGTGYFFSWLFNKEKTMTSPPKKKKEKAHSKEDILESFSLLNNTLYLLTLKDPSSIEVKNLKEVKNTFENYFLSHPGKEQ